MSKKILILANHDVGLYNFRKELLERLLLEGHEVYVSCPYGNNIKKITDMGCHYFQTDINRHGTNPLSEFKLMNHYRRMFANVKPDIIYSYTIKPNIYGALAAKKLSIPFVANVTGLGTAIQNPGIGKRILTMLYKAAFTNAQTVFFQNKSNQQYFTDHNIAVKKHKLLPGSGVNLNKFQLLEYPSDDDKVKFVFISRIMKDKGIEEYLNTAEYIKSNYPNIEFHICGFLDGDYKSVIQDYEDRGIIIYHGMVDDIKEIFKETHCTVHPSYHEGLSNVLLESAASARPVLASNIPGCKETFDEGINGYGFKSKSTESLIEAVEKILLLSHEEKKRMGIKGREKVEREFDRQIVVEKYLEEIEIAEQKELAVEGK